MQKNITITLSATSIFADATDDLDTAASTDNLLTSIAGALAPEFDVTVFVSQRDGLTVIDGDVSDDEQDAIRATVDGIWERGAWVVYA